MILPRRVTDREGRFAGAGQRRLPRRAGLRARLRVGCAYEFMTDLASRISTRVQLTTDGLRAYINAVADAFGPLPGSGSGTGIMQNETMVWCFKRPLGTSASGSDTP